MNPITPQQKKAISELEQKYGSLRKKYVPGSLKSEFLTDLDMLGRKYGIPEGGLDFFDDPMLDDMYGMKVAITANHEDVPMHLSKAGYTALKKQSSRGLPSISNSGKTLSAMSDAEFASMAKSLRMAKNPIKSSKKITSIPDDQFASMVSQLSAVKKQKEMKKPNTNWNAIAEMSDEEFARYLKKMKK
jgi:hypothetical protein